VATHREAVELIPVVKRFTSFMMSEIPVTVFPLPSKVVF
jgi:hypothetical protein